VGGETPGARLSGGPGRMWRSGPAGAADAEQRARNLAALNDAALALFRAGHVPIDEAERFRASGRPVYGSLAEVPGAR
jgi:hypothetical protein